ncbi:Fic family protein [Fusobacterium sp.]|uniref:Fic family protein n=1 Tax=Fusobacterium sp. TaxID=68766 RepID=UPI0025C37A6B|nr:Fic family protein [Fusobacterium sp.]MCI5725665.1 Fic family protein [Fusobacterium sp.]MCI7224158.1 Fic family protein [Fusobacterium sp.]
MKKIGKERAITIANKIYDELIYNASLSEGNQMTLLETASTISGIVPKGVRTKDVILVENLKNGLDYILESIKDDSFYFDKDTFCRINRLVASQDNFDNLGGFRQYGIKIAGSKHRGTEPSELEFDFYNTLNKYHNSNQDGIEIINLFLDLCKSQYFGDGNKRTAQVLMCGLLIKEGYTPFTVNFKDIEYSQPLVDFYDDENKRDIILNKLIEKQIETTKDFLSDEELKEIE